MPTISGVSKDDLMVVIENCQCLLFVFPHIIFFFPPSFQLFLEKYDIVYKNFHVSNACL